MAQTLKYKGYIGSIEASPEDNCLFGKLVFIRPLVNYEGVTVAELQHAFQEAVDEYLAECKRQDTEPDKPFKGVFNIRTGPERHEKAALAVQKYNIKSLNEFVNQAIDHELERLQG